MIQKDLEKLSEEVEKELEPQFKELDKLCEKNSKKVLDAFQECDLQEHN